MFWREVESNMSSGSRENSAMADIFLIIPFANSWHSAVEQHWPRPTSNTFRIPGDTETNDEIGRNENVACVVVLVWCPEVGGVGWSTKSGINEGITLHKDPPQKEKICHERDIKK